MNTYRILLIAFVFALSYSQLGFSQQKDMNQFFRFKAEQLGGKQISKQLWDEEGGCYYTDEAGFNYFDGYQTIKYRRQENDSNSILSDSLQSFQKIGNHEIWIAYLSIPKLTRFDMRNGKFQHFDLDFLVEDSVFAYPVVTTREDHDGNIWLLTWGKGIYRFNESSENFEHFDLHLPSDTVEMKARVKVFEQIEGDEYLICFFKQGKNERDYPLRFNIKTGDIHPYSIEGYLEGIENKKERFVTGVSSRIVHFAHVDENQNFWLGTYSGLLFMDNENKTLRRIHHPDDSPQIQNHFNARGYVKMGNELWITSSNRGIVTANMKTKKVDFIRSDPDNPITLYDNRIISMEKDPMGNLWVCSDDGMLSVYVSEINGFKMHLWSKMNLRFMHGSIQAIPVNQMWVNGDGIVYLSDREGLKLYDPAQKKMRAVHQLKKNKNLGYNSEGNWIKHFKKLGDTIVVISIFRPGFYSLNQEKLMDYFPTEEKGRELNILFRHTPTHPEFGLYFWGKSAPTQQSIFKYDSERNSIDPIHDLTKGIHFTETYTHILPSGNWMISERHGRFVIYDPQKKQDFLYSPSQKETFFPDSTINIAYVDEEDIWIGTDNGFYLFNERTGKSENYSDILGLNGQGVNAIIKDKNNNFWLALHSDLLLWNPQKKLVQRYDDRHGVSVGSFLPAIAQKDDKGNLYFACRNGLLVFNPNEVMAPDYPLKVSLTGVSRNGELLSKESQQKLISGNYVFHWDDDEIVFDLRTNQIFKIAPHRFKYRLSNKDSTWVDNGVQNKIRLSNLPHGSYTLEIKVINGWDIESDSYLVHFFVKRPFWLSVWFYIVTALVFLLSMGWLVKKRERVLKKRSEFLEQTVIERTAEVIEQKKEADHQREIVEEKQKEITDSINYAKRIQEAIMPGLDYFDSFFKESFILYKPKDIIAGDFYWLETVAFPSNSPKGAAAVNKTDSPPLGEPERDTVIFAAADCTGHGVPGAMVSVVCNNALNRSVREFGITDPGSLLDKTRELVIEQFEKGSAGVHGEQIGIKDGMDIALCSLNFNNTNSDKAQNSVGVVAQLRYAGANNPLWLLRGSELIEIKADKQPIGNYHDPKPFSTHELQLKKGDVIYLFSDGYADQFGGEKGKKFKSKSFRELLIESSELSLDEQKSKINQVFEDWKGEFEQVDDVCVIGVRI
ncbi:MAG: SpoIIE family protein phosphatase [Crocinitomicaceae bacterium]